MGDDNFFKLKKPFEKVNNQEEDEEDLKLDPIVDEDNQFVVKNEKINENTAIPPKKFTEEVKTTIPQEKVSIKDQTKVLPAQIPQAKSVQTSPPFQKIPLVQPKPIARPIPVQPKQITQTTPIQTPVKDKTSITNEIIGRDTYKVEARAKVVKPRGSVNVKIERVPTGIPGFDELIEGGFEKNSTNLLAGSPGVGKSIFATEFLMNGIQNKERCLYVSFEEKKEPFFANMAEFGWDLYKYEEEELFTFLEYSPNKVKTMLEEGGGDIESIIIKNKVSRIVLDSISAFTLLFENELEKREASLSLINMIKKWNCTSLLTYESQSIAKEQSIQFKTLDFESDSITVLYLVRNKNRRERYIEVLKMRGTNHSNNTFSYKIDSKGIEVSKNPTDSLPDL